MVDIEGGMGGKPTWFHDTTHLPEHKMDVTIRVRDSRAQALTSITGLCWANVVEGLQSTIRHDWLDEENRTFKTPEEALEAVLEMIQTGMNDHGLDFSMMEDRNL